jgi:hypothetical protein
MHYALVVNALRNVDALLIKREQRNVATLGE